MKTGTFSTVTPSDESETIVEIVEKGEMNRNIAMEWMDDVYKWMWKDLFRSLFEYMYKLQVGRIKLGVKYPKLVDSTKKSIIDWKKIDKQRKKWKSI